MIQISSGVNSFSLLAIPFFVLAGAIMAEGGMAVRLVNLARSLRRRDPRRAGAGQRHRLDLLQRRLGLVGRRHRVDRLGADPADGQAGLSEGVRHQRDDLRLGAGGADPAVAQRRCSIRSPPAARSRSRQLFLAGVLPGSLFGACVMGLCVILSYRRGYPEGRAGDAAPGREDRGRRAVGPGHRHHHPRRHPVAASSRPTESAAVACLYAFIVTMFIYRDYRWRELPMLLHRVTKMVAMVMMLIGFSAAFGYMMALMQVPAKATQLFLAHRQQQVRAADDDQHPADPARHLHGHGADDPDLHADPAAGDRASSASTRCTSA